MINPYRTLNSHLPERSPPAPDALPSDPKRLRTWVEALPRANHQAYLQALSHALDDFRTRRLEGFARLDALEVLRPMLLEAVTLLTSRLQGSTFPLTGTKAQIANQLMVLQRELALAYRMAVAEACAPSGKTPFLRGAQVALALVRATYHHVRWLATSHFLYRSPEPGAWAQLYALAAFASAQGLDAKPVEDAAERRSLSVALLQNQAALLSLANPYRFSQRELVDLWSLTRDAASLIELTPQRFAAAGALALIDHDAPPSSAARAPNPDEGDYRLRCLRWECSENSCTPGKSPTDFLPAAYHQDDAPSGCKCTQTNLGPVFNPPQFDPNTDFPDIYDKYRRSGGQLGRMWRALR